MRTVDWIEPQLAGPVRVLSTTRAGGVSVGPFASLNLGFRTGDDPEDVVENRRRLTGHLPDSPRWLSQVHGNRIIDVNDWEPGIEADGAWTNRPGAVVAALTADCLPVVLTASDGHCVAVIHAGWRGLAAGILTRALESLPVTPARLEAWIGPAIGPAAYEVGAEVKAAFADPQPELAEFFAPGAAGRFQADLKGLAARQLAGLGVARTIDSGLCTAADPERFFSHRRDRRTGRMATVAWLENA